jgi:hypothetical protein
MGDEFWWDLEAALGRLREARRWARLTGQHILFVAGRARIVDRRPTYFYPRQPRGVGR